MFDKPTPQETLFANVLSCLDFEGKPDGEIMALGAMMANWLRSEVSDSGSGVDTGAGFDSYDLWVKFGGKELFINIRESKK